MSIRLRTLVLICTSAFIVAFSFGALVTLTASAPQAEQHMGDHFSNVATVQNAVVRGDLEGVRESARWIADHEKGQGLPPTADSYLAAMKNLARQTAEAKDLAGAAQAASMMATTCGTCHAATRVKPTMPVAAPAQAANPTASHMIDHQFAVDLMWEGLIKPSDDSWKKGAQRLKGTPMAAKDLPDDPALTKEIKDFEAKVHALADKAEDAQGSKARSAIYGEIISGCGSCHGLHGRVWGPGVPKN